MSSSWTVGALAAAAGVTVRTLHHWESVGLLVPSGRTAAGYRTYDAADLQRLQRALAYRELGFPLERVRALLDDPTVDVGEELRRQSAVLTEKAHRLLRIAAALDAHEERRRMGIDLEPHEVREVFGDEDPGQYAEEAAQRWGDTEAWEESQRRTSSYGKDDWLRLKAEQDDLERRFAEAFTAGVHPASESATALAEEHRQAICRDFYDCPPELHRGLGRMYVDDERFTAHYDRRAPGLAAWLCAAFAANAEGR